jgi:RimJ/RimL family protein N-acetyltransferase
MHLADRIRQQAEHPRQEARRGFCSLHDLSEPGGIALAMIIETPRIRLRCWRDSDRVAFALMHAHPEVMFDAGGPLDRAQSDVKLDRYVAAFDQHGFCRWAVETRQGGFLGYAGVMPSWHAHPLGQHFDIGWRLARPAWGHGYATEAAAAALRDAFTRCRLTEVLAYTAPDNIRSQAVMARLRLRRDPSRDFSAPDHLRRMWHGLVWVATAADTGIT